MKSVYCLRVRRDIFHKWKIARFETKSERRIVAAIYQLLDDEHEVSAFDERLSVTDYNRIFN